MDEKRVADYFVVAGLPSDPQPLEDSFQDTCVHKDSNTLLPITDITVVLHSQGEATPVGFTRIDVTPTGHPADLNHGSIRSPSIYLCYRRGRDKPPLVDIGVLCEAKERILPECEVVHTTPYGRPANINNMGSRMFLTYRRAPENATCNKLVVTDVCVILANKGETPPYTFKMINRNLNKGMMGSDVFLCYKKSMNRPELLCYKPEILGRFPLEDYENFPLPESVPLFCLPMGATVESWPRKSSQPPPVFSTFVLTSYLAEKVYGAAVTFYEKCPDDQLTAAQRLELAFVTEEDTKRKQLHMNKSICILSRWPFFDTFDKFLRFLLKVSRTGPHRVPIERYISHFMLDIPFPSPQRPRILVQLADETISLSQPQDTLLPLSGASFKQMLCNLGADNCLHVLLYALTEQKILFHSLRPDVLTSVAEAVVTIMFPFHWQCPYIPLCPLGLSDVLSAPLPFIVGVDSRYFDLYEPPNDVACVDLDTNTIYLSEEKKWLHTKIIPKRPARVLRNSLQNLYEHMLRTSVSQAIPTKSKGIPAELAPFDQDFKQKMKERQLELEIQEAFLRFMAAILKGFRGYLLPITKAPTAGTTDPNSLFDQNGFMKSRDKAFHRFYLKMMKTQMFTRFIEERSFVSDKDVSLAFFDEFTEKVDVGGESTESRLLEADPTQQTDTTVFIAPPEPSSAQPASIEYIYSGFEALKVDLYHRHPAHCSMLSLPSYLSPSSNSPIGRRTKQEIKSAQKAAKKQAETPVMWARCLVSYCYSLWFIHLPAFVKSSKSKPKALKTAYEVLVHMQSLKFRSHDEVCYRVLMLLCGLYSQPVLAVKVLFEMKRNGVQPNAVTYGYYNKAVLESKWPSGADFCPALMWTKLRNVIIGVSKFRQGHTQNKCRRSHSLGSELDYDRVSHASSTEESMPEEALNNNNNNSSSLLLSESHVEEGNDDTLIDLNKVDDQSSGGQSDGGYSSMVQDDIVRHSDIDLELKGQENNGITSASAPEKPSVVRSLKFSEIDFSDSDAFRNRVGSIVRNSASSLGNLTHTLDTGVDSAAGVLIISHLSMLSNGDIASTVAGTSPLQIHQKPRRRHHSAGDHHAPPRGICSYSPSSNNSNNSNKTMTDGNEERTFFRTSSFGNDSQIIRKIKTSERRNSNEEVVTKPMVSGGSSVEPLPVVLGSKEAFGLSSFKEESEADLEEDEGRVMLLPRSRSPNIPIKGSSRSQTLEGRVMQLREEDSEESPDSSKGDLSYTSPIQDAMEFFGTGGGFSRMASSLRNSFRWKGGDKQNGTKANTAPSGGRTAKVTRSSTFHGPSNSPSSATRKLSTSSDRLLESKSEEAREGSPFLRRSLPRSSTLEPQDSPSMMRHSLSQTLSPARLLSESSAGLSKLTAKHSELFDNLKSVVTTKISEFKQSMSTGNTPTKGVSVSTSKTADNMDNWLIVIEGQENAGNSNSQVPGGAAPTPAGSASASRRTSLDYLSRSLRSEDSSGLLGGGTEDQQAMEQLLRDEYPWKTRSHKNNSIGGTLPHIGSAPQFPCAEGRSISDLSCMNPEEPGPHCKVALEVTLSTCFRCNHCSSILYDEEIMEGWTADESNLNTQCPFCKATFVPLLTVMIRDLRTDGSCESLLTPAQSTESSTPVPTSRIATPPPFATFNNNNNNIRSTPLVSNHLNGNSSSSSLMKVAQRDSIDSCPENFMLFEDSQFDLATMSNVTSPSDSPSKEKQMGPFKFQESNCGILVDLSPPVEEATEALGSSEGCSSLRSSHAGSGGTAGSGGGSLFLHCPLIGGATSAVPSGSPASSCSPGQEPLAPLTVPYLSPLVLRKEVENVLDHEGDDSLTRPEFVDQHPIIYWNMMFYFRRIRVPSHLPGLCLQASTITKGRQISEIWRKADSRNVSVHCLWDNPRIHEELGQPMYTLWQQNAPHSPLVHALVTEEKNISKNLMRQMLLRVQHDDLLTPIRMLMTERLKRPNCKQLQHSIYRELLFLCIIALGKDNINMTSFDMKYSGAYDQLSEKELLQMREPDRPPSYRSIFCRSYFNELELRPA